MRRANGPSFGTGAGATMGNSGGKTGLIECDAGGCVSVSGADVGMIGPDDTAFDSAVATGGTAGVCAGEDVITDYSSFKTAGIAFYVNNRG